jgi:hypothetical protein
MRSSLILCLACLLVATRLAAGEAAPPGGPEAGRPPRGPVPAKRPSALELSAEEEKWIFRAPVNRPDVLIDLEAQLTAQNQAKIKDGDVKRDKPSAGSGSQPQGTDIEQLLGWAKGEEDRIRQLVAARRYEEAMRAADAALKSLEPHINRPEVAKVIVSIRTYRAQAEEAKIRDDAQLAFEALKIQILGVLWSQDGLRMAIVEGENRALSVNDRVKDCAVINIDQDRVDFRFVFGRRRFEFPVYVNQSVRAKP